MRPERLQRSGRACRKDQADPRTAFGPSSLWSEDPGRFLAQAHTVERARTLPPRAHLYKNELKPMNPKNHHLVAIDIAKDQLCVLSGEHPFKVHNTPAGLRKLHQHLAGLKSPWVFCEATGGYERALVQKLHQNAILVTVLNPARVRHFARSEGIRAKNDPIDTRMILRFAQQKTLAATPPPRRPELTALMDRRTHLCDQLAREKTRLQNSSQLLHESMRRMIRCIEEELSLIEEDIQQYIQRDPVAKQTTQILQTVQGVGPVTAWAILAYLPEITQLSRNRISAMAGLAPFDKDSGKTNGPRHICGGRQKVRDILYMAALAASQHNPHIKQYVQRLIARGKSHKSALVAAMHKLLIHLQRLLKKQQICLVS